MNEIIKRGYAAITSPIHRLTMTEKFIIMDRMTEEEVDSSLVSRTLVSFARQRGSVGSTFSEGIVHTLVV